MTEPNLVNIREAIEKRLEELRADRQAQVEDLNRQTSQLLAPYDTSIEELEKMLELL